MQIDVIDLKILQLLQRNSRMQWKEVGKEVHMTGQAVGNRIKKMEDYGVIQAYSVVIDEWKVGLPFTAFLTLYLNSSHHEPLIRFIAEHSEVREAHRVSGDACYLLKISVHSQDALNDFLDELLKYGNYQLYLSIKNVKQTMISPFVFE